MRRLFLTLLAAFVLVPSAAAAPVFFVEGRGWGHGIGMPQYGAYGYAREEGRSHEWILGHYYRGTTLGRTSVDTVRVLLTDDRGSLSIGSKAAFTAVDGNGDEHRFAAGRLQLGPSLRVEVASGEMRTLADPVRFVRGSRFLELGGRAYRGQLLVRSSGGTLSAVNHVGLEEYLYGVVPDEMPPSWHMEALKAQAVAARSYAVVSRRSSGVFDLFSDTRSQVYGGMPSEEARTNAAIDATAGQVVLAEGRVAHTFFHSTSGGRTAAIHDVWNSDPISYLVSVPDPYDRLSPYHRWGPYRFTAASLARRLGSTGPSGRLLDAAVVPNRSQRADHVVLVGSRANSRVSGTSFQSRLELRSSWFTISVLSLGGVSRIQHGGRAVLRGIARGPASAWLERRTPDGGWERVRPLNRAAGGRFRVTVAPTVTSWFRIGAPQGKGDPFRVLVAPRLGLDG
jgi:stage II sporulation protein D